MTVRAVLVIAGRELLARLRDRSAIVLAVVAPLLLATVTSLAFAQIDQGRAVKLGFADDDHGTVGRQLRAALADPRIRSAAKVTVYPSGAAARNAVDHGTVAAAVVVPGGFSAAVTANSTTSQLTVVTDRGRVVAGAVAEAIADGLTSEATAGRLAASTAARLTPPTPAGAAARDPLVPLLVRLADQRVGDPAADIASYFGPSMALLALYFTVAFAAGGLWSERTGGTLRRMLVAPIRPATVLGGKAVAAAAVGTAGMALMWAATTLIFGVTWGPPAAVLLLIVASVAAATGITALAASLVHTEEAANTVTAALAFLLALVGGVFIPLYQLPPVLRRLATWTPDGQVLNGFSILTGGGDLAEIGTTLAALAVLAVGTGALAAFRFGRVVRG